MLDPRSRGGRREERGAVLVLLALVIAFMSAMGAMLMTSAMKTSHDLSELERARTSAEFLARASLDAGQAALETALWRGVAPSVVGGLEIADYDLDYAITVLREPELEVAPAGYQRFFSIYGISTGVVVDGVRVEHRRVLRANQIPLFQYAVFYEGNLRIHPGPPMTLTGPVHTNGDLWIRSSSGLTFDTNYVRTAGDLYNWCISESTQQVRYRKWVPDPFDPSYPVEFVSAENKAYFDAAGIATAMGGFDNTFHGYDANNDGDWDDVGDYGPWAVRALEMWGPATGVTESGQTVMDATHGALPIQHAGGLDLDPYVPTSGGDFEYDAINDEYVSVPVGTGTHSKGFLHANADLVFVFDGTTWSAQTGLGADVTTEVSAAVAMVSTFNGFAAGGSGQYDPTLSIDIAQLTASGYFPANGLIYLKAPGIGPEADLLSFRIRNGAELPGNLTVASEAPVYVQGDYNVIDKKPAAVMADQVCMLSNAWNDSKTFNTLPSATETTYNVSVYSGETAHNAVNGAEGNGGYHNVLRYHENWSGVPCHTRGSTVIALTSKYFPTRFGGGSHFYNPPNRDFRFDPDLIEGPTNLPPYSPMGVEMIVIANR